MDSEYNTSSKNHRPNKPSLGFEPSTSQPTGSSTGFKKPEHLDTSKNLIPELDIFSPLKPTTTFSRLTEPKDCNRRSSPQLEFIQDLISQVPKDDQLNSTEGSHRPLSLASPGQFESETMLTSMINDIEERLPSLNRPKDKQLRLTLQTLKSALVAERSQLQASRLDPILLHGVDDGDDIEADEEVRVSSSGSKASDSALKISTDATTLKISSEPSSLCKQPSTSKIGSKAGSDSEKAMSPLSRSTSLETRLALNFELLTTESPTSLVSHTYPPPLTQIPAGSLDSEPTQDSILDSSIRSEAFQATLRTKLSAKKFVAYAWCSWCFRRTIHGRAQRNLLRRSRYKCTECAQTTLKCRTHCGNMARGHSDYDEELW